MHAGQVSVQPGQMVAGTYEIVRYLGGGAMGAVFAARNRPLRADRALKFIAPGLAADDDARRRFSREARTLLFLAGTPEIVTLHDLIEDNDQLVLVMEHIHGPSLRQHVSGRRLSIAEVRQVGLCIGTALNAAHARQILHRDVKPDNVLVDERGSPRYRLADFGVAVLASRAEQTAVAGTLIYMAPEHLAGNPGPHSDVYSLGVMLLELMRGAALPFGGVPDDIRQDAELGKLLQADGDRPDDVEGLVDLVGRMVARTPGRRPTAEAVVAALSDSSGGATSGAKPLPPARAWVALAGSHDLQRGLAAAVAERIGAALARRGFGFNTEGCTGVEMLASRGLVQHLGHDDRDGHYLRHYLRPDWPTAHSFGKVLRSDDWYDERVRDASVMVIIAGGSGTLDMGNRARKLGRRIIPIGATGGYARQVWERYNADLHRGVHASGGQDRFGGLVAPALFQQLGDEQAGPERLAACAAHLAEAIVGWPDDLAP